MVVTLTGSNSYLLKLELKKLVSDFVGEHSDIALERLEGEEVEYHRLLEAVQSLPFLSAKRMVVVSELSKNKVAAEKIENLLDAVSDTTDLIIVEPKPDKRTVYYKSLQKRTDLKVFNELDEQALGAWLAEQAKAVGGSLSSSDAHYLVTRLGVNQLMLEHELEKLLLFDKHITRQTIDELTEASPQSSIFDLVDAAIGGRTERAFELYDEQRKQKVEPQQIVAMMAWQLHVLALIKTAGQRTSSDIASEAKLNPFVVRKSTDIARRLRLEQIQRYVRELTELDDQSKSLAVDPDEALKNYILELKN